jgi:hypothetical protein
MIRVLNSVLLDPNKEALEEVELDRLTAMNGS